MHFVAAERRAIREACAFDLGQCLFAGQHGRDVKQLKALDLARRPLHAVRVRHGFAQHLVAAADPKNPPAAPRMGEKVDVPALLTKEFEIGDRRLAAGQDDKVGDRQRLAGAHEDEPHGRLHAQRVEIVEIGYARQHWHGDGHRAVAPAASCRRGRMRLPPAAALRRQRTAPGRKPASAYALRAPSCR